MGGQGRLKTAAMFAQLFGRSLIRGRRASFYGITLRYQRDPRPFREDLTRVFEQLINGQIDPLIQETLPLEHGAQALGKLAAGKVTGKLVLKA